MSNTLTAADLNVALVGCGTVGSGVVQILNRSAEQLRLRSGRRINLRHVVIRDPHRVRDVPLADVNVTTSILDVANDP